MVVPCNNSPLPNDDSSWHAAFLAMLPAIRRQALLAFRGFRPEAKEDAIEEVVCNACVAFHRLVKQGRAEVACPSTLAGYAIRQYRAGRRTGNRLRICDVLSPYCWANKQIQVERLDRFDAEEDSWLEAVVEDHRAGPAETAAARIDIGDWFQQLAPAKRKIARVLAAGARTTDVARRFRLSPGRISQVRSELHSDWLAFQGEEGAEPDRS